MSETEKLIDEFEKKVNISKPVKNKGSGAGGKKTNVAGKSYEKFVDCSNYLLKVGFGQVINKKYKYLLKIDKDSKILFFNQRELNKYLLINYDKKIYRIPDQSILYIQKNKNPLLIIIEIKNQNVAGSVDDKLWAAVAIKHNYKIWLKDFNIEYSFILSPYLYNLVNTNKKKYNGLKQILNENNIKFFNGNDIKNSENIFNFINDNL